jgi:hypothetical protein
VLQTGAEDPQRHLRQVAVVGHSLQFGDRARLRQPCFERRRAETCAADTDTELAGTAGRAVR